MLFFFPLAAPTSSCRTPATTTSRKGSAAANNTHSLGTARSDSRNGHAKRTTSKGRRSSRAHSGTRAAGDRFPCEPTKCCQQESHAQDVVEAELSVRRSKALNHEQRCVRRYAVGSHTNASASHAANGGAATTTTAAAAANVNAGMKVNVYGAHVSLQTLPKYTTHVYI